MPSNLAGCSYLWSCIPTWVPRKPQVLWLLLPFYCIKLHTDTHTPPHMWHDQGEWVTCRQFSILLFQYKSLVHLKCYILIQTPSQLNIWLQRYEQFFKVKNNVKHKNLSPLLACNSKSIFPTSDSFPLIMSHISVSRHMHDVGSKIIFTFCRHFMVQYVRTAIEMSVLLLTSGQLQLCDLRSTVTLWP